MKRLKLKADLFSLLSAKPSQTNSDDVADDTTGSEKVFAFQGKFAKRLPVVNEKMSTLGYRRPPGVSKTETWLDCVKIDGQMKFGCIPCSKAPNPLGLGRYTACSKSFQICNLLRHANNTKHIENVVNMYGMQTRDFPLLFLPRKLRSMPPGDPPPGGPPKEPPLGTISQRSCCPLSCPPFDYPIKIYGGGTFVWGMGYH